MIFSRLARLSTGVAFTLVLSTGVAFGQAQPGDQDNKNRADLDALEAAHGTEIVNENLNRLRTLQLPANQRMKFIDIIGPRVVAPELKGTPLARSVVSAVVSFLDEIRNSPEVDTNEAIGHLTRLAEVLGKIGDPDADPAIWPLIQLLDSEVGQHACASECGSSGAPAMPSPYAPTSSAVVRLVDGVRYREAAAVALGKIGSTKAIPSLTAVLTEDRGNPGQTSAQQRLSRRLNARVRAASATALGQIGSGESLATLLFAANTDESEEVRKASEQAIQAIRNRK